MDAAVTEAGREQRTDRLEVVEICRYKVCRDPGKTLVTYSLGSCVSVVAYDGHARVGGMIHYALPEQKADREKAKTFPAMFGDSGLRDMFQELYEAGAQKSRLRVCIVGGASMLGAGEKNSIGRRNALLARKLLRKSGIDIKAEYVGGHISRTAYLDLADGTVLVRHPDGREERL